MFYRILIILFCLPAICLADEITFEWDYDTTTQIDGFRLLSGPMGQKEDGSWYPNLSSTPLIDNIAPDLRSVTANEEGWPGQSKKWCFVARAFRGEEVSDDSNVVCTVINNLPLFAPADVTGSYDKAERLIKLSWTQEEIERAKFWRIFYKIGDGEFTQLSEVGNSGQSDLGLSAPFDAVIEGTSAEVSFVVVGYKNLSVYSPNSTPVALTIDRTEEAPPLPPVENLRFSLLIPVI